MFPLCLTLAAQNTGPFTVMGGFMNGNAYLDLGASERTAYAAGFVNGMSVAALVLNTDKSQREPRWLTDCTKGMTDHQIAEIIRKDIRDRPAEWHRGLNGLSLNAMLQACKPYYADAPQR